MAKKNLSPKELSAFTALALSVPISLGFFILHQNWITGLVSFILIFFGVIGGALTFGFIGFFLGPTLLAVGYRLVPQRRLPDAGLTGEDGGLVPGGDDAAETA